MARSVKTFRNPFRPGAGHMPPYLAGRQEETKEFQRLLKQDVILENFILTGLRGVGKTVLLDTLKPLAIADGWLWVGTDLSESTSISEERLSLRLITDLAVVTSSIVVQEHDASSMGFVPPKVIIEQHLNFQFMVKLFGDTPGLIADKLKTLLEFTWSQLKMRGGRGVIFSYDEAQNLADHSKDKEFPLSLILDVFQSIQKKGIPFMLVLVGLPTLFPKLVEARTFAERMFRVVFLGRLNEKDCRDAVMKPIEADKCPVHVSVKSLKLIVKESGGYPYFIQFICREVYDAFLQKQACGEPSEIPVDEITRKLDSDFFSGRWARVTDRQRELLSVIAHLEKGESEFMVQEIAEMSKKIGAKPFTPSHINQMLAVLSEAGLTYRNRHGRYAFAVPLLGRFILRLESQENKSVGNRLHMRDI